MRVAYICGDRGVPIFGRKGCSVHAQEVVRALMQRGAQVEIFATRLGGSAPADLEAVPVHRLPAIPKKDHAARQRAALEANADLEAALTREGPYDVFYERYSLWSFAGMEYARGYGAPGLLEVNAPLIQEEAEHRGGLDRAGAEMVAQRAFGAATAILAVSNELGSYLEREAAAQGKVHVVPNGVDAERFSPSRDPARNGRFNEFTIGFVGTLRPWHGLEHLIDAFAIVRARCASARLLIVGDGPGRAALEARLDAGGLTDDVHFTSAVDPGEIPALLASMDVAVAPYANLDHFYFSPLKVYEYLAAQLPVVASRIGQLAGLLEDGVSGLLCPPGDAVAMAAALLRLEADPALREELGRAGREKVVRHHSWSAVAERILKLANPQAAILAPAQGVQ